MPANNAIILSMNTIQQKLLELSKRRNLSTLGLRETARLIDVKNPETIKYHLRKLQEAGLLSQTMSHWVERSRLGGSDLVTLPVLGSASAGPAVHLADVKIEGYIKVSSYLLKYRNYKDMYALKVTGSSMNQAKIDGKAIIDGDYIIVDSTQRSPRDGDHVVVVVDNLANVKRFLFDRENNQIVLLSESSEDFLPIFIHPDDEREGLISGKVIQVIKKPNLANYS